ncbi:VOC family protein [Sphingopyxis sp. C-1]|uniref:VOC family protein n=1 Tax=Sphingopyxis sp. C-1 TaxID=262667 RepID=UPI0006C53135|nr:VOC family protein [Sphingopyxis sp. C-1]GAO77471.1 catechol 2,3-dioxygenase [Sphingopyxis sp. C-1]
MSVLNALSVTLEVPGIEEGVRFYTDAGLVARIDGDTAELRCPEQERASVVLLGGYPRKRLHHVALRATGLDAIAAAAPGQGGRVVDAPRGFSADGLWVEDPHAMLIHLVDRAPDAPLEAGEPYAINAPAAIVRTRRSAMRPGGSYPPAMPLRLGHLLLFTPDVMRSVAFMTEALGMGLADRAQDVIAFTCARQESDHHVVAFAKSPGVGFHHASFQLRDPDEVGRGGRALSAKWGRGDWGLGRHTIGSNFFHYIQDPWGSWFEYYADMDYIDDYSLWSPTNYSMEDSLANWGPEVPSDFVHNYEADPEAFASAAAREGTA